MSDQCIEDHMLHIDCRTARELILRAQVPTAVVQLRPANYIKKYEVYSY